jgi:DNA-binding CsgD family transcriptional regulator
LSYLVDAAVWLQDADAAAWLLPMVEPYAGHNLLASEFLQPLGSADLPRARLLSLLGRPGAVAAFEAALEMDRRMGSTLHTAGALVAYSRHVAAHPVLSQDAADLAARARSLAERHGLVRVLRDLEELEGLDRPRWGLTPREQEVMALLGDGRSNREIAETLVISEYTAANHVRSILMKTQSANRTQAAVLARDDRAQLSTAASEPSDRTR